MFFTGKSVLSDINSKMDKFAEKTYRKKGPILEFKPLPGSKIINNAPRVLNALAKVVREEHKRKSGEDLSIMQLFKKKLKERIFKRKE